MSDYDPDEDMSLADIQQAWNRGHPVVLASATANLCRARFHWLCSAGYPHEGDSPPIFDFTRPACSEHSR